jgi:MscS family membrane protein
MSTDTMKRDTPSFRPSQTHATAHGTSGEFTRLQGWLATAIAFLLLTCVSHAQDLVHPLKPPDRSSPRATMKTFLDSSDVVSAFVADEYISAPTREGFHRMRDLTKVPLDCLDLSEIAPASRAKHGLAAALNIYEVLSRISLPPAAEIPGGDHPGSPGTTDGQHWTIPNTEITLVRGPTGEFLFDADTVARSAEFLARVQHMPYARPMPLENVSRLPSEGGGWLVPFSWVKSMPGWLRASLAGQAIWKWISLLVVMAIVAILMRSTYLLSLRSDSTRPLLHAVMRLALPAFVLAATPVVAYILLVQINFVGGVGSAMMLATTVLLHVAGAWIVWRIAPVVAEAIIVSPQISAESVDAHLIRICARLAGIVGAAALLALGADQLGVPVYGVVAGLGVGGLALALAAQPTIENLIGGLSLFADKPMKVGDFGNYADVLGTVEAIGLRSTRIRGNDRTLTTIPNAILSKSPIVNFAQRDRMLIQTVLGLRTETSPEQLQFVLAKLREMLLSHPQIAPDPVRVRLVGFGESTLDIEVVAYVLTNEWPVFLGIREGVFFRVMDIINQAGTSFAFPSQLHYEASQYGIDKTKAHAAEREVGQWKDENRFPFPDFSPDHARKIRGTLEYPPSGSPAPIAPEPGK